MSISGNKRVSQLVELTAEEIQPNDLFLIIDATARESKRIRASELEIYLQGSGSTVENATSASYVPGSGVDGIISLANMAYSSSTSLYALLATSASFSTTASFALNGGNVISGSSTSASFLIYTGSPNGTASYAIKSTQSDVASVANFLSYFGGNNGTASYAITTQTALRTNNADTASYLLNVGVSVATASYAYVAEIANSGNSTSSSFLVYSPTNGTASYAMAAKSTANIITDQGVFSAITQSITKSQLDNVDVSWSTLSQARTPIEAFGTITIPFTSSIPTTGTLYLSALDRNTGFDTLLDSTPISFIVSPTLGSWGNYNSGSIKQTFSLIGQESLYGTYLIYVSSSNNISIDSSRAVRFHLQSESDNFSVNSDLPLTFDVSPSNSATFTFTSTDGGPFTDNTIGLLTTMSIGKEIYTIDASGQNFYGVNNFWTLTNVTASTFSNNSSLTYFSGIPSSLIYLDCSNCAINKFYTFASSSLDILNCNNNTLSSLPDFPISMSYLDCANNLLTSLNLPISLSYLDCSNNNLTTLENNLPIGMSIFIANSNQITSIPSIVFPPTIISMSLNNNPSLLNFDSCVLPSSLEYISTNLSYIGNFPPIPNNVIYLSCYSCSLFQTSIDTMTAQLVLNASSSAIVSGTLDLRGNGNLSLNSLSNILVLNSTFAWTTLYDI